MSRAPDQNRLSAAARERAVEWHVRLASDAAEESDWLAFEAWLDESADNARAYEAVEALWSDLDDAAALPRDATIVRLAPRRRPAWAWPVGVAASVALAAAVAFGVWSLRAPAPAVYQTATGQTQTIALADGTHIRLNSGSRIVVVLGRRERHVEMADAEAAFDVAKDPNRPFVIDAGDRRIRVVGTEFDVLHHAGLFKVAVRRGIVEVRANDAPKDAPPVARLVRGQALSHRQGLAGDRVTSVDPNRAFSWTEGRLVYDDARLADVAADLERYGQSRIVVAPDASNLRLTAVLNIDAQDDMIRRLAGFLPITAVREGDVYRIGLRPHQR